MSRDEIEKGSPNMMMTINLYATGNYDVYADGFRIGTLVEMNDCVFMIMEYIQRGYTNFVVSSADTGEIYFEINV